MSLQFVTTISPAHTAEIALKVFLGGHVDALISAAALLGSKPAVRRTARLLDDVLSAPKLTRHMRRDLVGLLRLLSLECVDDFSSLEAACFSEIDPASPVVEEICELTDKFRWHLISLAEAERHEPLWAGLVDAA